MSAETPRPEPRPDRLAQLLSDLADGEEVAREELVALVHAELRELAARHMAPQRAGHTLQPTALVHEAWLRLSALGELDFRGKKQFYGFASRVMRSVLVDHARARRAEKRGGARQRLSISVCLTAQGAEDARPGEAVDLLDLDAALERLHELDSTLARVVELRFFGGLSNANIAQDLAVSERTVERHWRLARAWLLDELRH